ncbi:MAG: tyrosine-type recombinase/integrase [Henriciella sp.]
MASRIKPLTALDVQRLTTTRFVGGVPGLELIVSPGGTKSWRLLYRLPGSKRRRSVSLGRYPAVSLSDARKTANEMLAQASAGTDPKAARTKKVEARELSVADAMERYLAWCESNNASKTVRSKQSAINRHFLPAAGSVPLVDLSRRQIAALIDGLSGKPATRRQLYLYISHFLNWCVGREYIDANPMLGLQPPKPVATRERVLTDQEIKALLKAEGTIAAIAQLCLLTAQRKGSVEAMRWDEIDFDRKTWTIPGSNMKSGKIHVVPLSAPALSILKEWHRLDGPYVFGVGTDGARPFGGTSKAMRALRKEILAKDVRLHDLRRTAVTLAQRRGCSLDAIRALTQHKLSGVIGVYARHAFEKEKQQVVDAISEEVGAVLDG